jgi:hypothetical protein
MSSLTLRVSEAGSFAFAAPLVFNNEHSTSPPIPPLPRRKSP